MLKYALILSFSFLLSETSALGSQDGKNPTEKETAVKGQIISLQQQVESMSQFSKTLFALQIIKQENENAITKGSFLDQLSGPVKNEMEQLLKKTPEELTSSLQKFSSNDILASKNVTPAASMMDIPEVKESVNQIMKLGASLKDIFCISLPNASASSVIYTFSLPNVSSDK